MKAEQVLAIWSIMLLVASLLLALLGVIINADLVVYAGLAFAFISGLAGLAVKAT